ncbi:GNAT-like putative antirestriction protein [Streptomyces viridochromogenes]|uniref:GNAT-like putative antirestriction protein n=1 Tax=Streptomyces viridochromogenes TaxID=1938 RepID=UPI003F820BF4
MCAGQARTRLVAPRQPIEPLKAPRLREGDELAGPLTLSLLKPGQFNARRSRYLNPRIAPGAADLAVAVGDGGGRLLGVFAISPSMSTADEAYVLSVLAVEPTDCSRLSKLIALVLPRRSRSALRSGCASSFCGGVRRTAALLERVSGACQCLLVARSNPPWAAWLSAGNPSLFGQEGRGLASWSCQVASSGSVSTIELLYVQPSA